MRSGVRVPPRPQLTDDFMRRKKAERFTLPAGGISLASIECVIPELFRDAVLGGFGCGVTFKISKAFFKKHLSFFEELDLTFSIDVAGYKSVSAALGRITQAISMNGNPLDVFGIDYDKRRLESLQLCSRYQAIYPGVLNDNPIGCIGVK